MLSLQGTPSLVSLKREGAERACFSASQYMYTYLHHPTQDWYDSTLPLPTIQDIWSPGHHCHVCSILERHRTTWIDSTPRSRYLLTPPSAGDASIIELATSVYHCKGSSMINRCQMYLQVISLLNLSTNHIGMAKSHLLGNPYTSGPTFLAHPKSIGNFGAIIWQ